MTLNSITDHSYLTSIYWKQKTAGIELLKMPVPGTDPVVHAVIKPEELAFLKRLSNGNTLALQTVITAVYCFLLKRFVPEFEGHIVAGLEGQENLLLSLPVALSTSFREYLQQVKPDILEAIKHADYDQAVYGKGAPRDLTLCSLYGLCINVDADAVPPCNGLLLQLSADDSGGINMQASWKESVISGIAAQAIVNAFKDYLGNLEHNLELRLSDYELVQAGERSLLLEEFNATIVDYGTERTIVELFEDQVQRSGSATAVHFEGRSLSYEELNRHSNAFARYLQDRHQIGSQELVCVKLERSEWLIVALLGILKSGAAYVPVDPAYPESRVRYLESDSGSRVVLDSDILAEFRADMDKYGTTNLEAPISVSDLAYVIYTSGTTGNPKGVMLEHRNVFELVRWSEATFDKDRYDIVYAATSICFDLSIFEIFCSLCNGKPIKVLDNALEIGPNLMQDRRVLVNTVPSVARQLVTEYNEALGHMSMLNLAGEAFPADLAAQLPLDTVEVRNLYGPSEDTTYSTMYLLEPRAYERLPIGRPLSNTRAYILNEGRQLQPVGVAGRIYLTGKGLSRGYLNRAELTAEKFVANPYEPGALMYDTGDLGYWRPDGMIEFLGRKDHQVKVRGFRIELGEIEHALQRCGEDAGAVVVTALEHLGSTVLVAYYTGRASSDTLRDYLKVRLPEYMVPGFYIRLQSLPLTPNGKLDRSALPGIEAVKGQADYIAASGQLEESLSRIWGGVLGRDQIGVTDNFFELGGHSLLVGQILNSMYREHGLSVSYRDFFSHPTIRGLLDIAGPAVHYASINRLPDAYDYALSYGQQRLWLVSQLEGGSSAYNMSGAVRLEGDLDRDLLARCFYTLAERHEVLRTVFVEDGRGGVRQRIAPASTLDFAIKYKDLSGSSSGHSELLTELREAGSSPFVLSEGPLVRSLLYKMGTGEHIFFLCLHHIISDGWSLELLLSEVIGSYNRYKSGDTETVPTALRIQYRDYASWQNTRMSEPLMQSSGSYWSSVFSGSLPALDLLAGVRRPAVQSYHGSGLEYRYNAEFSERLQAFCRSHGLTLFMTLLSGVKLLLRSYSGQDDIIIGTPVAGRDHPDLEDQLGLYVNTLAIRSRFQGSDRLIDALYQVRDTLVAAYEHQQYPFDHLVGSLNLRRDLSRSALFDVMVVLQSQRQVHSLNTERAVSGVKVSPYALPVEHAQFDLSFAFAEEEEGLGLALTYNRDIYPAHFIENIFVHLEQLLEQLMTDAERPLSDLYYLGSGERSLLLEEFNATTVDYGTERTIVELFEDQVQRSGSATAVHFEGRSLSYEELNRHSNAFARYLQDRHQIGSQELVCVKLERSEWLIVALLGILKSGAAYVPVDPAYPESRVRYLESDSGSRVVLDSDILAEFRADMDKYGTTNLEAPISVSDLAYVIYTSGTTGNPKGVMLEHRNVFELVRWSEATFDKDRYDIVYAATSICFDLSIFEIFCSLCNGKPIKVLDNALEIGPNLMQDRRVLVNTVPSVARQLVTEYNEALGHMSMLNLAGEAFPADLAAQLPLDTVEVRNLYGPSEDTTYSTMYLLEPRAYERLPIGRPLSNTRAYILNEGRQLQPVGVAGRIYLTGKGLSRGYLNRAELTAEKFVANPYEPGALMYDTGDLGYWRPDGMIEFLGRKDHQVKVRGFRIELGEIEHALQRCGEDAGAVVVTALEHLGSTVLVAYYTGRASSDTLRDYLKVRLPEYMVPGFYIRLQSLPLTPNGKLDRSALPGIEAVKGQADYIAASGQLEESLSRIWGGVLGRDQIGVTDNFFELGGHSLLVGQILNSMYREHGLSVSYRDFFSHPTIRGLLDIAGPAVHYASINRLPDAYDYALSYGQQRLWLVSQLEGGSSAYNMSGAVRLEGDLDRDLLARCFYTLAERHEVLRTVFVEDGRGGVRQRIAPASTLDFAIKYKDLSGSSSGHSELLTELREAGSSPFVLSEGPLVRSLLYKMGTGEHIFFLCLHHIISDGWSLELLLSEVIGSYNRYKSGDTETVPTALRIQYRDYASWQNTRMSEPLMQSSGSYWSSVFSGSLPALDLLAGVRRPAVQSYHGSGLEYRYNAEFSERLQAFCRSHGLTLFMTLLSGVKLLLRSYSGQDDIIIGTPVAGRDHPDLEDQLGLYVNTLAIRSRFQGSDRLIDALYQVRDTLVAAYEHQQYPFDHLVGSLNLRRDLSRSALFDVMVVLQSQRQVHSLNTERAVSGVKVSPYALPVEHAQFDLSFAFAEEEEGLGLALTYNRDIYPAHFIENIFVHLEQLLEQLMTDAERPLSDLYYLGSGERSLLLEEFNATTVDYGTERTIVELFEDQVQRSGSATAVHYEGRSLSYEELNSHSNAFARYLQDRHQIGRQELVCVKLERSEWLIVALLGILKSGAAYVPVDPAYPESRVRYLESDSGSRVVLDSDILAEFRADMDKYDTTNLEAPISVSDLAYVIYTSGTTGNPKGVMIEHHSLVNLCRWHVDAYGVDAASRGTLFSSIAFDASVWEIYPYLISGGCLYPISDESVRLDTERLVTFLRDQNITHTYLPAKVCAGLVEAGITGLDTLLLTGGESLSYSKNTDLKIFNNYGPTESTVVATWYACGKQAGSRIPIGRPVSNMRVYILDDGQQLQPVGVAGRIYLSGKGLSRGYLNRPELTTEKFIANPYEPGTLMYDTGDLGYWRPDGMIEFLGRTDHQVKVRGYRIELGEIEHALRSYGTAVGEVVATATEHQDSTLLIAYYTGAVSSESLRDHLRENLPEYMVPGFYIHLESLPLTANGKLDRAALPGIETMAGAREYIAPSGLVEEMLSHIWKRVLGYDRVGASDNFFELGGTSLKLGKLINGIQEQFDKALPFSEVFKNPDFKDQARLIEEHMVMAHSIAQVARAEHYAAGKTQEQIWIASQDAAGSVAHNMPATLLIKGALSVARLEAAYTAVLERHEILRTAVFMDDERRIRQVPLSLDTVGFQLRVVDLHAQNLSPDAPEVRTLIEQDTQQVLEISKGEVLSVLLIRLSEEAYILHQVLHHIAGDEWSMYVIIEDLLKAYANDEGTSSSPLAIQYKDYAAWEQEYLLKDKRHLQFWQDQFIKPVTGLDLKTDFFNEAQGQEGAAHTIDIGAEAAARLKDLRKHNGISNSVFFTNLLYVLLHKYTGSKDFTIGLVTALRDLQQLNDQVGPYVNTLPVRMNYSPDLTFNELIQASKEQLLNAISYGRYPYEKIKELIRPRTAAKLQVVLNILNNMDTDLSKNGTGTEQLSIEAISPGYGSSKFPLCFYISESDETFHIRIEYQSQLFKHSRIEQMGTFLTELIGALLDAPEQKISAVKLLSKVQLPAMTRLKREEI